MYGIVDIGSNTMRLVIYKVEGGKPRVLLNKKEMAELASFIQDGMMVADGINRACYILDSFNLLAKDLGVNNLHVFATASLRNISNSQAAVSEIEDRTGLAINLLSGAQEAEYDFVGAARTIDLKRWFISRYWWR